MSEIYDDAAFFEEYSKMSRSVYGLEGAGEWHQLRSLFPDVAGKAVLDIGCGYGWHCRYAAEMGAKEVLGIDISSRMIAEARRRNAHPCVEYAAVGLETFEYPREKYDLVVSNLVLHYIENLDEVYANIRSALKPGGIFLFNIEHPVFTSGISQQWVTDEKGRNMYWPVDDYYYPGPRETVFLGKKVIKQHHTLTQILMGLMHTGFSIEAVEEAMPAPETLDMPGMQDEMRRPMMLLVRARRL